MLIPCSQWVCRGCWQRASEHLKRFSVPAYLNQLSGSVGADSLHGQIPRPLHAGHV